MGKNDKEICFHTRRMAILFPVLLEDFVRYDETKDTQCLGSIKAEISEHGATHLKRILYSEISKRPDDKENLAYRRMLAAIIRLEHKIRK